MRKPHKPREELIRDLSVIFRTYGFDGASLSLLTKGSGLERASLYHHFPNGKVDMAEAVLLQALSDLKVHVIDTLNGSASPAKKIANMIEAVEQFYNDGNDVCFITVFSLTDVSRNVTETMNDIIYLWASRLEKTLNELEIEKPKESAQHALASIQGGLILARATKDKKLFKNGIKHLKNQWLS